MSNELKVAIEAAKIGAKHALKYFGKSLEIIVKPDSTPATRADREAEEVIKQTILRAFPGSKFLGEESGGSLEEKEYWLIDPLDGTKNFIRKLPFWGVEIAYVRNGEIVVGVTYTPLFDELLYAEQGKGAYFGDKRLHVSKIARLDEAFLTHGTVNYFGNRTQQLLKLFNSVYRERGYGDLYGYGLVAQGKADIMMDAKNGPWDIAPLKVIVEEAGGRVTNFEGKPWSLSDPTAVATNDLLHDEVIRILNEK